MYIYKNKKLIMKTKKNYMRPVTTVLFYETESLLQALSDKNNSKGDVINSGVEGGGGTTTVTPAKGHDSSYDLWDDEEDYD